MLAGMRENMSSSAETTPLLGGLDTQIRRRCGIPLLAALILFSVISVLVKVADVDGKGDVRARFDNEHSTPWKWHDIVPSQELEWVSCYSDEFECARLEVPMDWQTPETNRNVVLGVIKLAAKTRDNPVPPLFMNPGGPGGSGVATLRSLGKHMQTIVGQNHDVISWDPRGVGVSTPRVDCWASFQKRKIWSIQGTPVVDERPGLVHDAHARALAYSGACETQMNDTGLLPHLSTAYSARDMLAILHRTGHEKLRYWGYSYGTILGAVYATLYPDTIDRFVSDGNVDYVDFFEGDRVHFHQDADSILDAFDEACHAVGPQACDFWAASPKDIQERRERLLDQLKRSPVILSAWAAGTGPEMPRVITYSDAQVLLRTILYKPLGGGVERLAAVYAGLERRDGTAFHHATAQYQSKDGLPMSEQLCMVADIPATEPQETPHEEDAYSAIMCSDGVAVEDTTEELEAYVERLKKVSRWAGASNTAFRLPCVGRTVRPNWRVVPNVNAQVRTGHPVLFINNLHDNVTPLESARNNSAHFPGSVLLIQNSYGHCTFAAPSTCTARVIHAYFSNGTLPEAGTLCEQDYNFFEKPIRPTEATQDELTLAMWGLSENAELGLGLL